MKYEFPLFDNLFWQNEANSVDEEAEERDIILSLDSYVIIEYIKSSVDIILNLKFEEIEKDKENQRELFHKLLETLRLGYQLRKEEKSKGMEGKEKSKIVIYFENFQKSQKQVMKQTNQLDYMIESLAWYQYA